MHFLESASVWGASAGEVPSPSRLGGTFDVAVGSVWFASRIGTAALSPYRTPTDIGRVSDCSPFQRSFVTASVSRFWIYVYGYLYL